MSYRVSRMLRWCLASLMVLVVLVAGLSVWAYHLMRASLPLLDGELRVAGLSATVYVERDAAGVPTIIAANRMDASRALGVLHAQERFFQMDLMRRRSAGELAELFGPMLLDLDRDARIHRFRHRANIALEQLSPEERQHLHAYTEGVNAGLAALAQPPFEYLLLRQSPVPWQAADTLLTMYTMTLQLQARQIEIKTMRGLLWARLPSSVAEFLDPIGTQWDAPLDGKLLQLAAVPDARQFNLRDINSQLAAEPHPEQPDQGSNAWAVGGGLTAHGTALLANDMHLELPVPNTWYRAVLNYGSEPRRVVGVTLPGTPAVVVGSNGQLAWGFTNSHGDWVDWITLDRVDDNHYQTADGAVAFTHYRERLGVAGAEPEWLDIYETQWGTVIDTDHEQRLRVLRWTAYYPETVNLNLMDLERAASVSAGLALASRMGIPGQNVLLADHSGQIAWTIAGWIPDRAGCDARLPLAWQDADRCWQGWLDPAKYPQVVNPQEQRLWSANARQVGGRDLARVGDGGYALGVRAYQIRDALRQLDQADEAALLALQLEDRSQLLIPWRERLLALLDAEAIAVHPQRAALRRIIAAEPVPQARVDSVDYRLLQQFRLEVAARVFAPLNEWLRESDEHFNYAHIRQREGPLWTLLQEQPEHWLSAEFTDWRELLLDAADAVIVPLDAEDIAAATWGEVNVLQMQHPLSRVLPWLSRWLDMPQQALPGGVHVPRVQSPYRGASQRLVVAPGREEHGLFHMPGGQSGHPLSPYYRIGHQAWVQGEPTPLLPGAVRYRLRLQPD